MASEPVDLDTITNAMRQIAAGDFSTRMPRDLSGSEADVLAFLINSLAEEVGVLVDELRREREELRAAKDRLVETDKLAALGLLAGGVAHEINQPLTVIHSLVALMRMSEDQPLSHHAEDLEFIDSAAARISRIVDNVRTFGRVQPFSLEDTDPVEPVADALILLADSLRENSVRVTQHVASEIPRVRADGKRLEQVFVNLLSNARDALDACVVDEREIEICIRPAGPWLVYEVIDSGPGVDPEVLARIFDPFFTTKPPTRGTGLGLSVSFGIVEEHCGEISYSPALDGRSRFLVKIPLVEPPTAHEQAR